MGELLKGMDPSVILRNSVNPKWWSFQWRYLRARTPWDTQITPPEVMTFLEKTPPGRAVDLGCGTGTNAIAMARRGWRVTGIDFVIGAILKARRKARAENLVIDFRLGDVTRLENLGGPFDYALDIGCLHALDPLAQTRYAAGLQRLVRPGGTFMLYAWMPRLWHGNHRGIAQEDLHRLLRAAFTVQQVVIGEEAGGPSAWYWFTKRSVL